MSKLSLQKLTVQSFVTGENAISSQTIKGGNTSGQHTMTCPPDTANVRGSSINYNYYGSR